jgi:hypothetical protein
MVKSRRSSDSAHPDGRSVRKKTKGEKDMLAGVEQRPSDGKSAPKMDPRIQREIGKHLRAHYDDVINEPVPEKFLELLAELERSVAEKK